MAFSITTSELPLGLATDRWLALEEIRPLIGSIGDACCPCKTIAVVEYATAGWVDRYNNCRLHSSLGNVPRVEHEQAHYAARNLESPRIGTAENLGRFTHDTHEGP